MSNSYNVELIYIKACFKPHYIKEGLKTHSNSTAVNNVIHSCKITSLLTCMQKIANLKMYIDLEVVSSIIANKQVSYCLFLGLYLVTVIRKLIKVVAVDVFTTHK